MNNSTPHPIVILGSKGQVGKALLDLLKEHAIGLDRSQANLENPEAIIPLLNQIQPSSIINAAAYTAVDLAEQNQALAMKINGDAPGVLARWCADHQIPFVHYSTDYVFSGEGDRPWKEKDPVSPLSSYGKSKLEGEKQIAAAGGKYLIFRTSWVYDAFGKNFVNTILRLGREKEALRIVSDQIGAPTYAPHLAKATIEALRVALEINQFPSGVFHLCNSGETTWHEFALAIFELARSKKMPLQIKKVEPILTSEYPTPATRPLNSRLNLNQIYHVLGVSLPDWKIGLKECMEHIK